MPAGSNRAVGPIPPKLIEEFAIPESLLVARVSSARMVSPAQTAVDMPIEGGFVGMVDRCDFDEWLRQRARAAGADLRHGTFRKDHERCRRRGRRSLSSQGGRIGGRRCVANASGARSRHYRGRWSDVGGRKAVHRGGRTAFAMWPRIMKSCEQPQFPTPRFDGARCDVFYQGRLSPDFYAWIFPHGETASVGVGSAHKGFSLRGAVGKLRAECDLGDVETIRREGAPIPMKPLRRWDNGRDVLLAGDAAGVVAPASGEGIYYAMAGGRFAAAAVFELLRTGDVRALRAARRDFMKAHGKVFWVLGIMQRFWYSSDNRRERFVSICRDPDVQRLTWQAYMHKKLVRARPLTHLRIFAKDMAHLLGLARA